MEEPTEDLSSKLNNLAEVDGVWKKKGPKINEALEYMRTKKKYSTGAIGKELENRMREYATDLYTHIGEAGNADTEILFTNLKNMLGDNFGAWKDAVKRGKPDQASAIMAAALEGREVNAEFTKAIDYHRAKSPDEQIKEAKDVVKKAGGTDYVKFTRVPDQVFQSLQKQKEEAYKLK